MALSATLPGHGYAVTLGEKAAIRHYVTPLRRHYAMSTQAGYVIAATKALALAAIAIGPATPLRDIEITSWHAIER